MALLFKLMFFLSLLTHHRALNKRGTNGTFFGSGSKKRHCWFGISQRCPFWFDIYGILQQFLITWFIWHDCLGNDEVSYQLLARQEAHKRIIWSCAWNPYGHEFATGSRDKTVKIWAVDEGSSVKQLITLPVFSSSVTALSWVGLGHQRNNGLLAVGMESGLIELWSLSIRRTDDCSFAAAGVAAAVALRFDPFVCHVSAVNRLAWKNPENEDSRNMQLASCGADHCVRVFEVNVD
jgi:WD40 repeat protein